MVNKKLNILLFLSLLSFLSTIYLHNIVSYILLGIVLFFVLFSNTINNFYYAIFLIPNLALFDGIGFKFVFNISMIFLFFKVLFTNKKLNIMGIAILLVFLFYELLISGLNLTLNDTILSSFTIFFSFFVLVNFRDYKIDNLLLTKSLFKGYMVSITAGLFKMINTIGIDSGLRFVGLLRDPNYFALISLFLICLLIRYYPIYINNKLNISNLLKLGSVVILGFLSVSKMYFLLLFILLVYYLLYYITFSKLSLSIKKMLSIFSLIIIFIIFGNSINLFELVINKYLFRLFQGYDITTGRFYLFKEFLLKYLSSFNTLLFGSGSNYRFIYQINYSEPNMLSHNTFLDILLSYGLIGIIIFVLLFLTVKKEYKTKSIDSKISVLFILLFLFFNLLSLLTVDFIPLLILIALICFYKGDEYSDKVQCSNVHLL